MIVQIFGFRLICPAVKHPTSQSAAQPGHTARIFQVRTNTFPNRPAEPVTVDEISELEFGEPQFMVKRSEMTAFPARFARTRETIQVPFQVDVDAL
jgi:hypothetical protein